MHKNLHTLFQQLEKQREEFSAWAQSTPEGKLHRKPAPDQWSAAQLLYHLSQVDKQVVKGLEKKLAGGKALRSLRFMTRFRSFLLNIALKLPLKFKAPAVLKDVPEEVEVPAVLQDWQETRRQLQQMLSGFDPKKLNKEVFFHPRAGMLTLPQTLRFMAEHTQHHRRQMQRLLS